MKKLSDYKLEIRKCSQCGLCQAFCPLFGITKNDCTIPRGQISMIQGILKNELKFNKKIKKYLDLCLNCDACVGSCPSGLRLQEIITVAKSKYVNNNLYEKLISFLQKYVILKLLLNLSNLFSKKIKSKEYTHKIIYFGGCESKLKGNYSAIKFLNRLKIEVITPNFECCGNPLFMRGDLEAYDYYINSFIKIMKQYDIKEVVTSCVGCEKNLKNYIKWVDDEGKKEFLSNINIINIYEYIKENTVKIEIKKPIEVTFHSPCGFNNYQQVKELLQNIKNIKYIQMNEYNSCCGLNGLNNIKNLSTIFQIIKKKRQNIIKTKTNYVLTTCLGCEFFLKLISLFKYKVFNLLEFIEKENINLEKQN